MGIALQFFAAVHHHDAVLLFNIWGVVVGSLTGAVLAALFFNYFYDPLLKELENKNWCVFLICIFFFTFSKTNSMKKKAMKMTTITFISQPIIQINYHNYLMEYYIPISTSENDPNFLLCPVAISKNQKKQKNQFAVSRVWFQMFSYSF